MNSDEATSQTATRRRVLAGAVALAGAAAGCAALPDDGTDATAPPAAADPPYERLRQVTVHVDDGADLAVPPAVETVSAPGDADLVVLPDDASVAADRVVAWLAAGRVVALFGDGAEATWLAWAGSDAFGDAFGDAGVGDADPDPQLVVAAAAGSDVVTHRRTWGNPPDDRDVLEALDEVLAAVATGTPTPR